MCVIIGFMSIASTVVSPMLTQCQLVLKGYVLNEEINEFAILENRMCFLGRTIHTLGKSFSNLNHFIILLLIHYSMSDLILNKNILWFKSLKN